MIEQLGFAVLNRRLDRLVRADDPPFLGAGGLRSDQFHSAEVTIAADHRPARRLARRRWPPSTRRSAARCSTACGQDELAAEIAELARRACKAAAEGAATRTTPAIADEIVGTLDTRRW